MQAVRSAGFTDGEIAEIIAHVALNIFTNYFNNTAGVEVDFPKIAPSPIRLARTNNQIATQSTSSPDSNHREGCPMLPAKREAWGF